MSPDGIHTIICDAVNIKHEFVRDAMIPVRLISMKAGLMCQPVKFCVDHLMVSLHQPHWMASISLQGKTNFFFENAPVLNTPTVLVLV
jgi:hypothetical protein